MGAFCRMLQKSRDCSANFITKLEINMRIHKARFLPSLPSSTTLSEESQDLRPIALDMQPKFPDRPVDTIGSTPHQGAAYQYVA
ncbi:unnamed protein product [Chondrus crispus]|uniref:Uncharacterized protein n=1 Tax=Chondrus crispus TaxID=2769 RepID=R7QI08_CHOCR|nr:unnamed protein product [Chondrus crispus]CDF38152.1 unnamed protein product [Chondrus crispus]|eukprot:XP_005718021.1 unnamed protein product [Chondrus crispus]